MKKKRDKISSVAIPASAQSAKSPFFNKSQKSGTSSQRSESIEPFFISSSLVQKKTFFNSPNAIAGSDVEDVNFKKVNKHSSDNQFFNCDESNKSLIQEHYNRAIIQLSAAITRLDNALINMDKGLSVDYMTESLLKTFFKTTHKNDVEVILNNFEHLDAKMVTGIKFKCIGDEKVCYDTAGYVNRIIPTSIFVGPVHICEENYQKEEDFHKTKVIIHEAAHRFISARDKAYVGRGFGKLKGHPELAMNNADSYAWFAMMS